MGGNLSLKNMLKIRIDELENVFNEKVIIERFFIRKTLILNLIMLSYVDNSNAELYVARVRELGYHGAIRE